MTRAPRRSSPSPATLARLVVMISGGGTNLQALLDADLPAEVCLVVSNRPDAYGLQRARDRGCPTACLTLAAVKREGGTRQDYDARLASIVAAARPDLVVLAGFMHVLSPAFLDRFPRDGIVNLHPSLLPADLAADEVEHEGTRCRVFRGHDAVEQAFAAAVPFTGTCVHYVTAEVDRGPVIAQARVPRCEGDTVDDLRRRIQQTEHILLPQAIGQVLAARGFPRPPDGR